jgi:hypothetical protein
MVDPTSSPQLEFTLELRVNIGPTLELGQGLCGTRRHVPIRGGSFHGPQIAGRVMPGGADWQFVELDGLTFVDARYVIETEEGIRIGVRNHGVRHGSKEVIARLAAGETVPSDQYYFRTTPRFYPPEGRYGWLKRSIFLGNAERFADLVVVQVWKVT